MYTALLSVYRALCSVYRALLSVYRALLSVYRALFMRLFSIGSFDGASFFFWSVLYRAPAHCTGPFHEWLF